MKRPIVLMSIISVIAAGRLACTQPSTNQELQLTPSVDRLSEDTAFSSVGSYSSKTIDANENAANVAHEDGIFDLTMITDHRRGLKLVVSFSRILDEKKRNLSEPGSNQILFTTAEYLRIFEGEDEIETVNLESSKGPGNNYSGSAPFEKHSASAKTENGVRTVTIKTSIDNYEMEQGVVRKVTPLRAYTTIFTISNNLITGVSLEQRLFVSSIPGRISATVNRVLGSQLPKNIMEIYSFQATQLERTQEGILDRGLDAQPDTYITNPDEIREL